MTDIIKIIVPWDGEIETGNGVTAATISTHIAAHDNHLREALLLAAYNGQDDPTPEELSISVLSDERPYILTDVATGNDDEPRDTLSYEIS